MHVSTAHPSIGKATVRIVSSLAAAVAFVLLVAGSLTSRAHAQTMGASSSTSSSSSVQDTAIIFQPSKPLIETEEEKAAAYRNTIGFDASFSDYGFGGGGFYSHAFSPEFTGQFSVDLGTAKGSRELGIEDNKLNRIFVIPVMLSAQYRLFRNSLSDNLRPYVTVGAGPVLAMTTPYSQDFFSAFSKAQTKVVPGGFTGIGANFGLDRKSTLGASLKYFFIPYPGGIQSTSTQRLENLSGLFLTVNYGFNF